jgi:phenylalanyl-tRNA synthetase alpha chain
VGWEFLISAGGSMSDSDILLELGELQRAALVELAAIVDEPGLQAWRVANLGRSAPVMQVFTRLPQFSKELRPQIGQRANQVKLALEAEFAGRAEQIRQADLLRSLERDRLDVSLPGRKPVFGRYHVQTQILREIYRIFGDMGFQIYRSPDVETDELNFTLLNLPPHHPARDMQASFYTTQPGVILRTQTSPGQMRAMREFYPEPIRVMLPGMCYRYEQVDARHEVQFYQVELLAVDKGIHFGNLKATLDDFTRRMFGAKVKTRLRPSYFPFTEPSAELDVECFVCGGKGCGVCKHSGWLEILGCGMVHPVVLQNGGYDPREWSGFAAGLGPERISMLRYRIDDIRNFWSNDVRFLEQY